MSAQIIPLYPSCDPSGSVDVVRALEIPTFPGHARAANPVCPNAADRNAGGPDLRDTHAVEAVAMLLLALEDQPLTPPVIRPVRGLDGRGRVGVVIGEQVHSLTPSQTRLAAHTLFSDNPFPGSALMAVRLHEAACTAETRALNPDARLDRIQDLTPGHGRPVHTLPHASPDPAPPAWRKGWRAVAACLALAVLTVTAFRLGGAV